MQGGDEDLSCKKIGPCPAFEEMDQEIGLSFFINQVAVFVSLKVLFWVLRTETWCTLTLRILLKPWSFSFTKDTYIAKTVFSTSVSKNAKILRFTLQMKDLVLLSLVRTWKTFSEVVSSLNLEWCGDKKALKHLNLLTTLSTSTLSWYTQTWLSTILLVTQRFHCCNLSPLFGS